MKPSTVLVTIFLAVTTTQACPEYESCWCESDNPDKQNSYWGKSKPDDVATAAACKRWKGHVQGIGYDLNDPKKNDRHDECLVSADHAAVPVVGVQLWKTKAINRCEWERECMSDAVKAKRAYCRNKISLWWK